MSVLRLEDLPNAAGFHFVGVTKDGKKVPCVVELGQDRCYKVAGAAWSDLAGWCRRESSTHLPG